MKKIFFVCILILCLTGCTLEYNNDLTSVSYQSENFSNTQYEDWTSAGRGMRIKQFSFGEQNIITVLRVDKRMFSWAIAQDSASPKMVSKWRKTLNAAAVINGGYFDENNQSTGYLLLDDREYGKLSSNGENGYTGMLLIKNKKPQLRYLPEKSFGKEEKANFALQTFPTLINNGKSLIKKESGKTARRTVLAQSFKNDFYIIISESFISLYELAAWLEKSGLALEKAINLDGGPSTGLAVKNESFYYKADSAPVPNVIYLMSNK